MWGVKADRKWSDAERAQRVLGLRIAGSKKVGKGEFELKDRKGRVVARVVDADAPRKAKLGIQPVSFEEACEFIRLHHRHHPAPQGWKFGVGVNDGKKVVGVATVGRPVARGLDDGWTLEVTRCCTDGTKNAGSALYGACWRAARALGFKRIVTYTLDSEPGTSLRAAGYTLTEEVRGRSWSCPSRPRVDTHPLQGKFRWERSGE